MALSRIFHSAFCIFLASAVGLSSAFADNHILWSTPAHSLTAEERLTYSAFEVHASDTHINYVAPETEEFLLALSNPLRQEVLHFLAVFRLASLGHLQIARRNIHRPVRGFIEHSLRPFSPNEPEFTYKVNRLQEVLQHAQTLELQSYTASERQNFRRFMEAAESEIQTAVQDASEPVKDNVKGATVIMGTFSLYFMSVLLALLYVTLTMVDEFKDAHVFPFMLTLFGLGVPAGIHGASATGTALLRAAHRSAKRARITGQAFKATCKDLLSHPQLRNLP